MLGCCNPFACCWKKRDKIQYIYDESRRRLAKDLDIVKITRAIRHLKALVKASIGSKKVMFEIAHSGKNIIALDNESSSDSDPFQLRSKDKDRRKSHRID